MSDVSQPVKKGFVSGAALSTLSFCPVEHDHIPLEDDRLAEDAPAGVDEVDSLTPTEREPRA
ncbi:MAG TPA: hypothetical protein VLM85_19605 [Polyangiaceae bacterium]|nr:hypothetical protein [Polyangiaceae bacterium]